MVVVDESSNMRTNRKFKSTSQDTKACYAACLGARRCLLLSGTPVESRPYEIWHQVDALTQPVFVAHRGGKAANESTSMTKLSQ
eukprot:COSAG01_NODE_1099_length_11701_cov_8.251508_8_plen_84_part_00